ncbi:MAG: TonB family protein [Bacteroidales bacterium]
MSSKENKSKHNSCIPHSTLIAYVQNELSGHERNAVERHLSICPMCADVLDGLSELDDPNEIYEVESDINNAIDKSIASKGARPFQFKTMLYAAASVALILAVSSLVYYYISIMPSSPVLSDRLISEEEIIPLDSSVIERPKEYTPELEPDHEAVSENEMEAKEKEIELRGRGRRTPKSASVKSTKKMEKPQPSKPMKVAESLSIVDDDINIEATFDTDKIGVAEKEQPSDYQLQSGAFIDEEEVIEEEVFMVVEEMPTFIGSDKYKDFKEYISKNIKYPEFAAESGVEGRVFVQFIVEPDGSVSNVEVVRGVDPELDKEAVRVVKNSPKWEPGKQRGIPVRVSFSFPVIFSLE